MNIFLNENSISNRNLHIHFELLLLTHNFILIIFLNFINKKKLMMLTNESGNEKFKTF